MTQISETMKDAAMLGITVCVAAGDDGSSDAVTDGNAHVDFPSSSPYALAVGAPPSPAKPAPQKTSSGKKATDSAPIMAVAPAGE